MIIYSKNSGLTPAAIGRLETPVKMIIEHESDRLTKEGGIASWLFNIEKSNRFGETIVGSNEFDVFRAAEEGGAAENDTQVETYTKFIEHIQFMKEFTISAEMMEDANYGVAADAKRRAESFARAYYKTMHKICEKALISATNAKTVFARAQLDLTSHDGLPLFHSAHTWGNAAAKSGTQSNYFYGNIFSEGDIENRVSSTATFERALSELSVKIRNMLDETASRSVIPPTPSFFPATVRLRKALRKRFAARRVRSATAITTSTFITAIGT